MTPGPLTIIEPASGGRFRALLDGCPLTTSRTPLLTAARALLAEGADPETELVMTHAGSPSPAMRTTVGEAAALMISEGAGAGLCGGDDRGDHAPARLPQGLPRSICRPRLHAIPCGHRNGHQENRKGASYRSPSQAFAKINGRLHGHLGHHASFRNAFSL